MQVNQNKKVAMKCGGLNRSRPVGMSPAESSLVKPFNDKAGGREQGVTDAARGEE